MTHARTLVKSTITALALALCLPTGVAIAQPSSPQSRTVPAATVPILLAITGDAATVTPIDGTDTFRLRIRGTNNDLTWFTDNPVRRTGHMHVSDLAGEWSRIFAKKAPTSALIMRSGGNTSTFVVDLTKPSFANDVLAFTIEPIVAAQGAIPSNATDVDLMIDEAFAVLPKNPAHHPRVTLARHLAAGMALAAEATTRQSTRSRAFDTTVDPETPAPVDASGPATDSTPSTQPTTPDSSAPAAPQTESAPPTSDAPAASPFTLPNLDWTYHTIIPSRDSDKYIAKNKIAKNDIQSNDNFIYSMPAVALVSQFSDHHLDVINTGVVLIGHTSNIYDLS